MSANLQTLLKDALLNNTYDYSVLHDTLKSAWTNSYSYLYQLQKSYIEYEERTYISNEDNSKDIIRIGHLYINKSRQVCFDIDYNFIHVCNREEFKRSKFYKSSFSFNDMTANPNIFHKLPVILIDNKAIWDYKLNIINGKVTIILPFNKNFIYNNKLVYQEHKIQVFIIDNVLYDRLTVNKQVLTVSSQINQNNTDTTMSISIKPSWLSHTSTKEGVYFVSVHIPNNYGNDYALSTTIMPCIKHGEKLICKLNVDDYLTIKKYTKDFYVSVIFINQLHLHTFYTGNGYTICGSDNECNLSVIQQDECIPYTMPIPVENLMVIKERNGILSYVHNTDTVELFYPNIYRIKDEHRQEGDVYYIYYFYKYDNDLKYTPSHYDFYYDFLKIHFNNELIEKIVDNIYRGKIKYIEDIAPTINDVALLDCLDSDDTSNRDYILVCGSAETLNQLNPILTSNNITPAIVNDAFINTFNRILHYDYYKYNYGEIDFIKRYLLEDGNTDKDPIEYKDETLKEWIHEEPNILKDYVLNQNKLYNPIYHLWTKNIDLISKLRTDTSPELGEKHGFTLAEECYVFAFHNDTTSEASSHLLNLRVFVDGLFVNKLTHIRHYFTDYLYIPKSMVTDDSYIEIEIFPSYQYTTNLNFKTLNDSKLIQLFEPSDGIYPTAADVFYVAPTGHIMDNLYDSYTNITPTNGDEVIKDTNNGNASIIVNGKIYEETTVYDPALFQLTAYYDDNKFDIKTTDSQKPVIYTRLKTFKVKPLSESILNTDIVLCIAKVPNSIEIEMEEDSFPEISLTGLNFSFSDEYLRIFKNGKLVPKSKYMLSTTYSFPRITFFEMVSAGDILYIDITPYRYKEIYYQRELINGQCTIDLTGYIDKPFDIRYYDVYLNGRRLSLNNVISVSPWKITLVNIKSIYNLQIFEKERDYEYFGSDFSNNNYYYTIDDLLESDYIYDDEKQKLLKKIIDDRKDKNLTIVPNENSEEKIDYNIGTRNSIYTYLFYTNSVVPIKLINPDQLQLNKYYIEISYPNIITPYHIIPKDFSRNTEEYARREKYEGVFMLDPDIYLEGDDKTNTNTIVYPITHLNDIDDSLFDTTDTE